MFGSAASGVCGLLIAGTGIPGAGLGRATGRGVVAGFSVVATCGTAARVCPKVAGSAELALGLNGGVSTEGRFGVALFRVKLSSGSRAEVKFMAGQEKRPDKLLSLSGSGGSPET
jgi:hypothetical protein